MNMKITGPYVFLFTLLLLFAGWIIQVIQSALTGRDDNGSLDRAPEKSIARLCPLTTAEFRREVRSP